ncbi:MAG TPA: hypothetical protein VH186_26710 [Chloroflexia bacterium]|nr:hypothetical protein [Chloroflexia bacterium]
MYFVQTMARKKTFAGIFALVLMAAMMMALFGSGTGTASAGAKKLEFKMVPSNANIAKCLPKASAEVEIEGTRDNQRMTIEVKGLAPNTGYDFFVTQVPKAPFGLSWYQSDLHTNNKGEGSATVRGIFSNETFTVSPGALTTLGREGNPQTGASFGAVNMYHLGLWFNDPQVPFNLGCEPGATSPIVTPFNGEQHAGIQVLNTSNFADNAGPLKKFIP